MYGHPNSAVNNSNELLGFLGKVCNNGRGVAKIAQIWILTKTHGLDAWYDYVRVKEREAFLLIGYPSAYNEREALA